MEGLASQSEGKAKTYKTTAKQNEIEGQSLLQIETIKNVEDPCQENG